MAIKDLLVKRGVIEEKVIEKIISRYVKYSNGGKILFMGKFYKLKATEKIKIYLIAKIGWKYIPGQESLAVGATNSELGNELKIPSDTTVRTAVKRLRDKGFLETKGGIHSATEQLTFEIAEKG